MNQLYSVSNGSNLYIRKETDNGHKGIHFPEGCLRELRCLARQVKNGEERIDTLNACVAKYNKALREIGLYSDITAKYRSGFKTNDESMEFYKDQLKNAQDCIDSFREVAQQAIGYPHHDD